MILDRISQVMFVMIACIESFNKMLANWIQQHVKYLYIINKWDFILKISEFDI